MASRVVECIDDDLENQDLAATLCRTNQIVSCSGLTDGEYLDIKEILQAEHVKEFEPYRHMPFPQDLKIQLTKSQSNIAMGLLPSITKAWMSIDNDLFFWNFDTNEDLSFFDALQDTILKVEIVKPKPSLVEPEVHFLLVVFTTTEIILLSVYYADESMKPIPRGARVDYSKAKMIVPAEILFSTPNDCKIVQDIANTSDGRIFFIAGDCLYELTYQNKTWLRSARCDKINITKSMISHLIPAISFFSTPEELIQIAIDDSRHFLYTLGERGTITCYDLGADGTRTDKIKSLSIDELRREIRGSCAVEDDFLSVIRSIKAITSTKSQMITLEAVTSKALRIYLTVYHDKMMFAGGIEQDGARAGTLRAIHVRYPPNNVFGIHCGNQVYTSFVDTESVLVAQMPEDESTVLNIFSRSSFQYTESNHVESYTEFSFNGSVWAMARKPFDFEPSQIPGMVPSILPPWVTKQHFVPSRKYYMLTSEGIYVFLQHSPLQMFRQIIRLYDTDSRQFQWFLSVHFATEVCIMAVCLLCSNHPDDVQLHNSAARILVEFGGEAIATVSNEYEPSIYAPNNMSVANISAFPSSPLKSSTPQNKMQIQQAYGSPMRDDIVNGIEMEHIRPSNRHEALYIYFSRLVSNIWDKKICYRENEYLINNLPSVEVEIISDEIGKLLSAIQQHNLIHFNTTAPHLTASLLKAGELEHNSLLKFVEMTKNTYEILNLWKIMDEHQFSVLTQLLPDDVYQGLTTLTFYEMVTRSQDVATELITCIIKHYIGDEATTALISTKMSEKCPSLFTQQDAHLLKASEFITTARHLPYGTERFNYIRKSVDIILKSVNRVNMDLVCSLLQQVHAYDAIVEVALERAKRDDPTNIAVIAYKKRLDMTDSKIREILKARESSYKYITELLTMLQQIILQGSSNDIVNELSVPMAENQRNSIIDMVLNNDDELAQVQLFKWMLQNNMEDKLLNKQHKFFEDFLYYELHEGSGEHYLGLLWKYYEKNENYLSAAKLLLQYAESSPNIALKNRLDYLSHALLCIQSAGESRSNIELKNRIQEFLGVAHVQQLVRDEIEKTGKITAAVREQALKQLDTQLFNLTQLYTNFANNYELPKMKLTILKCANHYDAEAVEDIWREILEQELGGFNRNENADQVRRAITESLSKLYKVYSASQEYIPLSFILRELMLKSFHKSVPTWMPQICRDSRIPLAAALKVAIAELTNDPFWRANAKCIDFLVDFGRFIFDDFIKNYDRYDFNDRSVLKEQCMNFIAALTLNTNTSRGISTRTNELKIYDEQIQRIH